MFLLFATHCQAHLYQTAFNFYIIKVRLSSAQMHRILDIEFSENQLTKFEILTFARFNVCNLREQLTDELKSVLQFHSLR